MCLAAVMSSLGPCPSSLLSVLTAPVRLRRQLSTSPLSMSSASPHTVTRMSAPLTGRSQPGSPSPVRHPADSSPCAAAAAPAVPAIAPAAPPPPKQQQQFSFLAHRGGRSSPPLADPGAQQQQYNRSTVTREVNGFVAAKANWLGMLHLDLVGHPSHQRPPSIVLQCFGMNEDLHMYCQAVPVCLAEVWGACECDIIRLLQRRRLALLLVCQPIGNISVGCQANLHTQIPGFAYSRFSCADS